MAVFMRAYRTFNTRHLFPSDTLRYRPTPVGMAQLRHKQRHKSVWQRPDPFKARRLSRASPRFASSGLGGVYRTPGAYRVRLEISLLAQSQAALLLPKWSHNLAMRIEGLRKYRGRNPNGYFEDLPPDVRFRAHRWLGYLLERRRRQGKPPPAGGGRRQLLVFFNLSNGF